MDLIRYRHRPRLQHLIIQLLLLHLRQLIIQLRLINRLTKRGICDSVRDLLAQRVLFPKVLPVKLLVPKYLHGWGKSIHSLIHNIDIQLAMNLLHSLSSLLHRRQRLTIDIRRLDRVDLLLQRRDLRQGLVERVFMLLLALQRCSCRCVCISILVPSQPWECVPHHSYS